MDPSKVTIPPLLDLTIDNITSNVNLINSNDPDPRLKYILERLVVHLHDFARETRLSTNEWMAGINFLTSTGQICTPTRQEFILLSDIFGLSLLVDSIDHPKPEGSTDGTVLGPFHTHEAEHKEHGCELMTHDPEGVPLLVLCTVKDVQGKPVDGVKIDIWETDSSGHYDVQRPESHGGGPDGRCVMTTDEKGVFWFKAVEPVPYPIPHDGPVGQLLKRVGRHPMRPAHMHFMFEKEGYDHLITALYIKGSPYETSDAVFGVKKSLIAPITKLDDESISQKYGVPNGISLLRYDFVLVSKKESEDLRAHNSAEALKKLGRKVKIVEGLPVPDVD